MYDLECVKERAEGNSSAVVAAHKQLSVRLVRRRTLALGRAPFAEGVARRPEPAAPAALQLEDSDDDPLAGICAGQEFGLLRTTSGKVRRLYTLQLRFR